MDLQPIAFPPNIGTSRNWTPLECQVGFTTVKACLLSPRSERRRERYQTGLLFDLLNEVIDAGNRELARFAIKRVLSDPKDFGKLSQISDYTDRLYFQVPGRKELGRDLRYMRNIITTGLTLKMLAAADATGRRRHKLEDSQRAMSKKYKSVIGKNELYPRIAWSKWRHVAHLCAAIIDYLPQSDRPVVDKSFLQLIERDLPNFLATASSYQRFLITNHESAGVLLSRQMFKGIRLLTIPEELTLGAAAMVSQNLPDWR